MREAARLRGRYRAILAHTGLVLLVGGLLHGVPLLAWPLVTTAESPRAFLLPALVLIVPGLALWRGLRPTEPEPLSVPEGGVIVLLSWSLICLVGAWPFVAITGLDGTRALFESVSGWTTTGLTVVDVATAGPLILLWRSTMQLAGGAGLAIIMLAAITGPAGPALSQAEGREQLVPQVRRSAKLVLSIYGGYVAVGILAYRLAGMDLFDAVNHAFTALSTGGFSTRVESIGGWNAPLVEAVTLPLMLLGSLNVATAWLLLQRRFRLVGRNGEVRLLALALPLCAAALFLLTCRQLYPSLGKGLRVALFETVSALSTTGFATTAYDGWNGFGWLLLIALMLIGGGTCSTAGGIKQYRVHLLWRALLWELRRPFLPRTVVMEHSVWVGDRQQPVPEERLRQVGIFLFLFLLCYGLGVAVLTGCGIPLAAALFEFASAIGTVGLSVGVTSAQAADGVLWTEMAGMFLGRLEFLVVFISLAKLARDLRVMCRGDRAELPEE